MFRAGVDLVNELYEDARKQTLRYVSVGEAAGPPLHLGLLIDVSESMGEDMRFTTRMQ